MTSKNTFYVGIFLLVIAIIMLIVLITYQSSLSGNNGGCCNLDLIVSCNNSPAQIITEIIYSIILIIAIYIIEESESDYSE